MAVMDASVALEMLLRTSLGLEALDWIVRNAEPMDAPHLIDLEVMYALRRLLHKRELTEEEAKFAVENLAQLQINRHGHILLLPRIWNLRESVAAYDASYVALAESLDTPLFTCDAKLSRSQGHRAKIVLLS
ncbi:MAG TPA: type II toxin-antitoxin system VapC family toxin [Rhizomicrobium sp.]|jgi:predicted nucleic acid-binding protein